jgi:hypothetical protein
MLNSATDRTCTCMRPVHQVTRLPELPQKGTRASELRRRQQPAMNLYLYLYKYK